MPFWTLIHCTSASATVPLSPAADGHLTVPAFINGGGPFPFILDTGADESAAYLWFAQNLHLPMEKPEQIIGQTGTATISTFKMQRLSLDGRSRRNLDVDGLPNRHDDGRQAGVAGNDFMDGAVVIFDYPCRTVSVIDNTADFGRLISGARRIAAHVAKDTSQLIFPVWLNGVQGFAVLDTGSRDTRINNRFAKLAKVDLNSKDFKQAAMLNGASGAETASKIGPIGTVHATGLTVSHAQGRVIDLPVFRVWGLADQPAMILGMDQMRSYRLIYDHLHRQFWFTHSQCDIMRR